MNLEGRVAVVTGGAAGIGRATVLALRAAGASVLVVDLDEPAEHDRFVRGDVTKAEDIARAFAVAEAELGGVDVLVNNVGGAEPPCFPDAPPERWNAVLDRNLRAPMTAIQAALPSMRRRGGGAIVNVSSMAGIDPVPYEMPEYGAAKAGLVRLTSALATLAAEGIRVSCVCPGWVDTPSSRRSREALTPDELAELPDRILPAEQVASLIVDLARDDDAAGRVVAWPDDQDPRPWPD